MILITGSAGFIGSHLMDTLPNAVGVDKRENKMLFKNGNKTIQCNLLNQTKLLEELIELKPEFVLHNAARPSVPDSYTDPCATYLDNVAASISLFQICKIVGVKKVIFTSSSSVYGSSPYGHSKKVIEETLKHLGIPYTILRYFNVFGPRQRENVARLMLEALKNDTEFTMLGDGKTSRDFTHIDNVIAANIKAMDPAYDGKILEVGTGQSHSLRELFSTLKQTINPSYDKLKHGEARHGDIKYSKARTFLKPNEITYFYDGVGKWLREEQNYL